MQLSPATSLRSPLISRNFANAKAPRPVFSPYANQGSSYASAEIHAYIASRDMAVADAERTPTDLTLNRAFLANELVESFLQPSRTPYQAQGLDTAEAMRELQRCEAAKRRINQLRACSVAAA